MGLPSEIDSGLPGFRLWPAALSAETQAALVAEVMAALEAAPLYQPVTPGGRPFSVRMSNLGPLGWVSDAAGYRYQPTHPETGVAWPAIPAVLLDLWAELTGWAAPPDACLVNLYRGSARMGLHQDRDEADLTAPVLSVSLGDTAVFRIGPTGPGPTRTIRLSSGDICALTGPARLARHGVDRVLEGSSRLIPGGGRINLTLRRAAADRSLGGDGDGTGSTPRFNRIKLTSPIPGRPTPSSQESAMPVLTRPEGQSAEDLKLSRRTLGAAALGGAIFSQYAVAALAQSATPLVTDAAGLVTAETTYRAPDGFDLPAYVARPEGEGPFPVVIVVSEIFGVHAYIADICRRLAKQGYAAIAPAFFVRVEDPAPLSDMGRIRDIVTAAQYEQVMGDVSATLDWAGAQPWAESDKIGITGYCWGGKVVWQACARFAQIKAGVAWYGQLAPSAAATPEQITAGAPWPVDLAKDLKAPVLGLYGGQDRGIPLSAVEAMRAALAAAGKTDSAITVYPDAEHGFHADYRASYNAADAADGWTRLLALFAARLKQG